MLQQKQMNLDELLRAAARWRLKNQTIVFTNGCFDLLHPGHVRYLADAASLGHRLVVGLNSDASVKRLKGPGRPIQNQQSRADVLASLHVIDAVLVFDEDTPLELIRALQPDVLVKGGDWKPADIVGSDLVLERGGIVKSLSFVEGFSTSSIEASILSKGK